MGKFNIVDMCYDCLVPINGCDEGALATVPSVVAVVAAFTLLLAYPLRKF